jgi:hypothetical protein
MKLDYPIPYKDPSTVFPQSIPKMTTIQSKAPYFGTTSIFLARIIAIVDVIGLIKEHNFEPTA